MWLYYPEIKIKDYKPKSKKKKKLKKIIKLLKKIKNGQKSKHN